MRKLILSAAALPLLLAACGSDANPGDEDGVETVTRDDEVEGVTALDDPSLVDIEGEVVAVAGGTDTPLPPMLQPAGPVGPDMLGSGAGGCTFKQGANTLLVVGARDADKERAKGVIQIAAEDLLLEAEKVRGLDELGNGINLTDGTYSVEVRKVSDTASELAVRAGLGPERVYRDGSWSCGA